MSECCLKNKINLEFYDTFKKKSSIKTIFLFKSCICRIINTEENKDKQATERKNETLNEVLSSKSFFASVETPIKIFTIQKYFITNTGSPVDKSFQFFHPPQTFSHITA